MDETNIKFKKLELLLGKIQTFLKGRYSYIRLLKLGEELVENHEISKRSFGIKEWHYLTSQNEEKYSLRLIKSLTGLSSSLTHFTDDQEIRSASITYITLIQMATGVFEKTEHSDKDIS